MSATSPAVTGRDFRASMASLASSVHVVTSASSSLVVGITATAVCSVTDSPPSVLVCLNSNSVAREVIGQSRVLGVDTLAASQVRLADHFAGRGETHMALRFMYGIWSRGLTGSPLLTGCLSSLDCEVESTQVVGSHEIFICRVVGLRRTPATRGLGYVQRRYFDVPLDADPRPTQISSSQPAPRAEHV